MTKNKLKIKNINSFIFLAIKVFQNFLVSFFFKVVLGFWKVLRKEKKKNVKKNYFLSNKILKENKI